MEAVQARTKQANLPISYEALVAIMNRVMPGTNNYADKMKAWNQHRPDKPTW